MSTLVDKLSKAASDMGFDNVDDLTSMLAEHGLAVVLKTELDVVNGLMEEVSNVGAKDPDTHKSQCLMYDVNAYLARNGLGKWKR